MKAFALDPVGNVTTRFRRLFTPVLCIAAANLTLNLSVI
jgi:hypothetical protein